MTSSSFPLTETDNRTHRQAGLKRKYQNPINLVKSLFVMSAYDSVMLAI